MPLAPAVFGAALTESLSVALFKVPVAAPLADVDGADTKPPCLIAATFWCVVIDDRSDVLIEVFVFLQIGGAFEGSKSKYSNFPD